ncbi:MAG: glycosyltransferase [Infirmifilum uzonense]|uniref:glycosyltransferase n=1 Tax=Infirmifilum uzonense TaxID=1550241 RepID=UPI003C790F77
MSLSFLLVFLLTLPIYAVLLYYLMIIAFASRSKDKSIVKEDARDFSIEVVVPVRGEPLEIVKNTLLRNKEAYESTPCVKKVVILSDDDVQYFETLKRELEGFSKVEVLRRSQPKGGRTGALDHYFSYSTSDYILVLDVDGTIDKESLNSLCMLSGSEAAYVLPWKGYSLDKTRVAETMAFFTDLGSLILYRLRSKAGFFVFPLGSGTLYNRDAIIRLGGWGDNVVQDDILMGVKLASNGFSTRLLENSEIQVLVPSKLYSLRKQQARWAFGTSEVLSRNFKRILDSPLPLYKRMEMFAYLLQPLETLLPFLVLVLAPIVALLERPSTPFSYQFMNVIGIFLPAAILGLLQGFLLYELEKNRLKGLFKYYIINLGRFSAILAVLSPYLSFYALKGLLRGKIKWEVTLKGQKEKISPKEKSPLWIAAWSGLGIASSMMTGNLYTLFVSLLFMLASLYCLLRLEL